MRLFYALCIGWAGWAEVGQTKSITGQAVALPASPTLPFSKSLII